MAKNLKVATIMKYRGQPHSGPREAKSTEVMSKKHEHIIKVTICP